jgi:hypothetical protein
MTIEIAEFRCPTCNHIVGEEEYRQAYNTLDRKVQEICKDKMREQEIKHREEADRQEEKYSLELQIRVKQEVEVQRNKILSEQEVKTRNDKALITEKHEQEMRRKDEEIKEAKLQSNDKKIEEDYRQRDTAHRLQIDRIIKQNIGLAEANQKLQKTLESIPAELRGTAAEMNLYEDLHKAFPQDDLVAKTVGVEMPDVVQTIVTESGERIPVPILWDMKTGKDITTRDIEKAKRYKENYNADDCILVTETGITAKDTKNHKAGFIGKRDGILLVHKSVAVAISEETRSYIIKNTRLVKNGNGRSSKQIKLYDYITSPMRLRKMMERIKRKSKIEDSIRRAEDYMKKSWTEQKKEIQFWFKADQNDEKAISDILQEEVSSEMKEDVEEEEVSSEMNEGVEEEG